MARRRFKDYPKVAYGPYGSSMTIHRAEDMPPGWSTASFDGPSPVQAALAERIPYTRSAMKRALHARGIAFPETAADSELYARLNSD